MSTLNQIVNFVLFAEKLDYMYALFAISQHVLIDVAYYLTSNCVMW